jgi:rhombotail lipoprotein
MTQFFPRGSRRRLACLIATLLALPLVVSSCGWLDPLATSGNHRQQATTPLVDYLYGNADPPRIESTVELPIPITVGLTFLPTARGAGPTAVERDAVLQSIRERFGKLSYVRDIVIVPNYYLGSRHGNGFEELQRIAQLQRLDVIALVSYDQLSQTTENKRSLAYLTIAGAFFVRGNEQATHTLLDLAIVEPHSRALMLRAGGTSSLHQSSTAIDLEARRIRQQADGFAQATKALNDNFARELAEFETRIREGRAPVRIAAAERGGSGALDALQLWFLAIVMLLGARAGLPRGSNR